MHSKSSSRNPKMRCQISSVSLKQNAWINNLSEVNFKENHITWRNIFKNWVNLRNQYCVGVVWSDVIDRGLATQANNGTTTTTGCSFQTPSPTVKKGFLLKMPLISGSLYKIKHTKCSNNKKKTRKQGHSCYSVHLAWFYCEYQLISMVKRIHTNSRVQV